MVSWPHSSSTDQPVKAAVEALTAATRALPMLLPDALQLVSSSTKSHSLPDVQLDCLRDIAMNVPCPPVDPGRAAEMLSTVILDVSNELLCRMQDLLESPDTLAAFFKLLAEAVSVTTVVVAAKESSAEGYRGLCEGKLRETLLATPDFIQTCLDLAGKAMSERVSDSAVTEILRFCAGTLANGREGASVHRVAVVAALPKLCVAVCYALNQECLLDLEILEGAAEVLTLAAVGYGMDFAAALIQVLDALQVPEFNRQRLQRHVDACADWGSQKLEWLEQLQQIVREWQSERRHMACI